MQTFLTSASFEITASVLDTKRLGKQRLEAYQILKTLIAKRNNVKVSWENHPAVLMWAGHEEALLLYLSCIRKEWVKRGCTDNMQFEIDQLPIKHSDSPSIPSWVNDLRLHRNHKSRLLAKSPDWYIQWGWDVQPEANNLWPIMKNGDTWIYTNNGKRVV